MMTTTDTTTSDTTTSDTSTADTSTAGTDLARVAGDPDEPGPSADEEQLREQLAPFVAWLATQALDEPARRRHRAATERFLRWSHTDTGPAQTRRRRYERHLHRHHPDHVTEARAGLGWWADHRELLALPIGR